MKKYRPGVTSGLILGVTALVASLAGQSFDRSLSHSVGPVPSGRASAVGPATVATTGDTAEEAHARQVYASLPPSFEANRGQTDQEVRFLSRGRGYTLFLTPSEAVLVLKSREAEDVRHERSETNSGAESSAITLAFIGADRSYLDSQGDAVLETGIGEVWLKKPFVYQEKDGSKTEVDGRYLIKGRNQLGFHVGEYDADRPLIIDPVLTYSTYLGGSGSDFGDAIAMGSAGSKYIAGSTGRSTNLTTVAGGVQTTFGGGTA